VEKDVPGVLRERGARLRGQIAWPDDVNLAVGEDGGGVAEDEVDASLDVGIDIVLASEVSEEGVLIAEKTAVLKDRLIGTNR